MLLTIVPLQLCIDRNSVVVRLKSLLHVLPWTSTQSDLPPCVHLLTMKWLSAVLTTRKAPLQRWNKAVQMQRRL